MKILFLDQSGKPGGAELCLIDIAKPYGQNALVGLFADGSFKQLLQQNNIPVEVLRNEAIAVRKESGFIQGLNSFRQLIPLIIKVIKKARKYDLIYANTQKALVVGAIASFFSRRPLVYHLHDILSTEHFSQTNLRIAVNLANRFASLVIANSQASQTAFIKAGGRQDIIEVVYNGFELKNYQTNEYDIKKLQQNLELQGKFVVGHFSRLAPWKGQHILIDALAQCPPQVTAILVGDALFGEQNYVQQLHEQVAKLGLENRVKFLGFRSDIPQLMAACDLVAHTSTSPEPFGRVIVEAMLCEKPVIAAKAGGAMELIEHGLNGFLVTPGEPQELAQMIITCLQETEITATIAKNARITASQRFDVATINQQIAQLLSERI
ncbi:glycosyl transferase family 1 [Nostoc linckia z18]|uniref:Glycosyl transferase family 1 n=2 Tax=Nostoc linckia TaxID=92942 RepID=A0A9Q5ZEI7_NOSLI|nr:glycosyltransferase family 4 protein [Nostoc linckia]PHK33379.1 glycosyl transferase family 1 [Nostoc linckia z15]PHK47164.1 glycosyl transferase family 1 [Nostoc linckia z16]PHJ63864.1 glycosyl transferase family 1 [Nostoc linckia z1]PHJ69434.1 glycosyl transferase family 1 [Nostoc linckia z3]PHJ74717.1 glycosyl transferase family 1 [Nostoc linckia z2]